MVVLMFPQHIVLIGIGIGAMTSLTFHLLVNEGFTPGHVRVVGHGKSMGHLLKDVQLYQVSLVYMATRLFVNLSQVYIPLYLHESLNMGAESLAVVPLVMYLASFAVSFLVKILNKKCGRKVSRRKNTNTFHLAEVQQILLCKFCNK
jgi:hypothetical protein